MSQEKLNNQTTQKPIALVGGGSGGHIFPLVAIAEELASRNRPFYFIGTEKGLEKQIVTQFGWQYYQINAGKWRRYINLSSLAENFLDIFRTITGFFQAVSILRKTKTDTLLSKGGYVSLPVTYAARMLGKRIIVHESDAVMGLSNRLASGFADRVLTAFETGVFAHKNNRFLQVGIPIRKVLRTAATLKIPKKTRPLILLLPGSQGSSAINQLVKEKITQLLALGDVVHLTGRQDYNFFQKIQEALPVNQRAYYKPYAFIDRELPYYFQAADLLIARASATTVAEAALFKKAVYLIPLPTSASNHQVINARLLEKAQAALIRQEYQLSPDQFVEDIAKLLSDPNRLKQLGDNLHTYFNADQTIDVILKELDGQN